MMVQAGPPAEIRLAYSMAIGRGDLPGCVSWAPSCSTLLSHVVLTLVQVGSARLVFLSAGTTTEANPLMIGSGLLGEGAT
jgi:hypothetical protein